jgi:hypothetical protein
MVEAVIVVIFLAIALFALVSLAGLYRAKIRVIQESRFRATYNATKSCTVEGASAFTFFFPPIEDGPDVPFDAAQELRDIGRGALGGGVSRAYVTGTFAYQSAEQPPPKPGDPPLLPRFGVSGKVTAQSVTACNPVDINVELMTILRKVGLLDEMETAAMDAFTELGGI